MTTLSESELRMLPHLLEAAEAMEMPFWIQNYGDPDPLLASVSDAETRRYLQMNYGPWDRMKGEEPFLSGVGVKPPGANFYPADITVEEFKAAASVNHDLKSPFTMVRRDAAGDIISIPYHSFFKRYVQSAAEALHRSAELADSSNFQKYLQLRAEALLSDDYRDSDMAWMALKDNTLDILVGPMEIEDRLFGIKTAYAASILVKDWESSRRIQRYVEMLPWFQESLPVPEAYKKEKPGMDAQIDVYGVIRFAGLDRRDMPVGVAWPADEVVQLHKGTRYLLLKDVMQAKFDGILNPISNMFIANEGRSLINFQADFHFIMFHEIAHGLGIKHTVKSGRPVRESLGELHYAIEEGKANLLSQLMAIRLYESGKFNKYDLLGLYATALVRALYNYDGPQSVMQLNYFKEAGAYSREPETGRYKVHQENMLAAVNSLAERLLRLQGDGDYEKAQAFLEQYSHPDQELTSDITRQERAKLPIGLVMMD